MLREQWATIAGKTAIDAAELDEGEALAEQLTRAIGGRLSNPAQLTAAADARQRAFTLFINAYDQARRVAAFLRWAEGDADKLVPSVYGTRASRTPKTDTPPVERPVNDPAHAALPTEPTAPAMPVVAPGFPGGSPFVSN
jgi:hypothetical protein